MAVAVGTKENALNIANADPCKQITTKINRGKAEDNATRETKGVMTLLNNEKNKNATGLTGRYGEENGERAPLRH